MVSADGIADGMADAAPTDGADSVTADRELKAKRDAIAAAVAAARARAKGVEAEPADADAHAAAIDAKRAAIAAALALAQARDAASAAEDATATKSDRRKLTAKDLFGFEEETAAEMSNNKADVKDYRMQGNYGHTKFIKP